MFAALTRRRRLRTQAAELYDALIRQVRQPAFYRELGVPDSFDGRFDLLVLHAFLLFRRLGEAGEEGQSLSQAVFDAMFADMDDVLRESGVGDLSIDRKIRAMSQAFYGRVKAYDEALAGPPGALEAALGRNVYAGEAGRPDALAAYVRTADAAVKGAPMERVAAGAIPFPQPGEARP